MRGWTYLRHRGTTVGLRSAYNWRINSGRQWIPTWVSQRHFEEQKIDPSPISIPRANNRHSTNILFLHAMRKLQYMYLLQTSVWLMIEDVASSRPKAEIEFFIPLTWRPLSFFPRSIRATISINTPADDSTPIWNQISSRLSELRSCWVSWAWNILTYISILAWSAFRSNVHLILNWSDSEWLFGIAQITLVSHELGH